MLPVRLMLTMAMVVGGCVIDAAEQSKETGFHHSLLSNAPALFDQTGNTPPPRYLSYLSRQKYLFLYFGGSQCVPCKKFTPELIAWYQAHGGGKDFEVLLVGQDSNSDDIKTYMKTAGMPWLAFDKGKKWEKPDPRFDRVMEKIDSKYIPTLVLLDENDQVVARSNDGEKYLGTEVVLKKYLELTKGK
jgi:thiol-disulfide isomerase/thioredoxin